MGWDLNSLYKVQRTYNIYIIYIYSAATAVVASISRNSSANGQENKVWVWLKQPAGKMLNTLL